MNPQERKKAEKIKTNQRTYIYVYDYERHKNVFRVEVASVENGERDFAAEKKQIFILSLARSFMFFRSSRIPFLFRHNIRMQKPQCGACSEGKVGISTDE